jgi:hypothetical protein
MDVEHLFVGLNLKETGPARIGTGRSARDEGLAQPLHGFGGMSPRIVYLCCLCEIRYAVHDCCLIRFRKNRLYM